MSQFFSSGGQSIGVSASAFVLPVSIQGWFPLGLTGLIFLLSKGLSRAFSSTRVQRHHSSALRLLYGPTLTSIYNYWKAHRLDDTDLCHWSDVFVFNTLPRFVIAFLPRSNCLLISWLQSLSSDFGAQENKICHCFHFFPVLFAMKWWDWMLWSLSFFFLNIEF